MAVTARSGIATRLIWFPETTKGTDPPGPGYILPVTGTAIAGSSAPQVELPIFDGTGQAPGTVLGDISLGMDVTMGLEFQTIGNLLKAFFGSSSTPVATAGAYMHYFPLLSSPPDFATGQLQYESQEVTAQYIRNRYVGCQGLRFPLPAASQGQTVVASLIGIGDEVQTDLAVTKTNNGFNATSTGFSLLTLAGTKIATVANFTPTLTRPMTPVRVAANSGVAAGLIPGLIRGKFQVQLIFETTRNLNDYSNAINQTVVKLEAWFFNQKHSLASQWLRLVFSVGLFERKAPMAGGERELTIDQQYVVKYDPVNSAIAGEVFSNLETFNVVSGVSDKLGIKVDGGGTITKTLTAGAARTASQIVTDIGAVAGGFADVMPANPGGIGGRLRIGTNTLGPTGSIAIDTTIAQTAHTVLGFDSTVRAGKAAQTAHAFLFGPQSTQY